MKTQRQILDGIGKKHFMVETLETQRSDRLDFHEVAVWQMKEALLEAYRAGHEQGQREGFKEGTEWTKSE